RRDVGDIAQLLLEPVLDRLDIVVGLALDRLHRFGVAHRKLVRDAGEKRASRGRERRHLGDRHGIREGGKPSQLDLDPVPDQGVFAEMRLQRGNLALIPPVQRGQGGQGGKCGCGGSHGKITTGNSNFTIRGVPAARKAAPGVVSHCNIGPVILRFDPAFRARMKLYASLTSPYARKVRIVFVEKRIECALVEASTWDADSPIPQFNPLGKVPVLVFDDGTSLFDSRVIVEYLDSVSPVSRLLPEGNRPRIAVRR